MTERTAPLILKSRAEIILQTKIDIAYYTDQPNILRCVLGSKVVYVDLQRKEEVPAALLNAQETQQPAVITKGPPKENFTAQITREKAIPAAANKPTAKKKATKTQTKKK